jgi:hypothetical protein
MRSPSVIDQLPIVGLFGTHRNFLAPIVWSLILSIFTMSVLLAGNALPESRRGCGRNRNHPTQKPALWRGQDADSPIGDNITANADISNVLPRHSRSSSKASHVTCDHRERVIPEHVNTAKSGSRIQSDALLFQEVIPSDMFSR